MRFQKCHHEAGEAAASLVWPWLLAAAGARPRESPSPGHCDWGLAPVRAVRAERGLAAAVQLLVLPDWPPRGSSLPRENLRERRGPGSRATQPR